MLPALPAGSSRFFVDCSLCSNPSKKLNRHSRHTPGPRALTFVPALFLPPSREGQGCVSKQSFLTLFPLAERGSAGGLAMPG